MTFETGVYFVSNHKEGSVLFKGKRDFGVFQIDDLLQSSCIALLTGRVNDWFPYIALESWN